MSTPAIPNIWYQRKVADNAAKSCWVCYKPSVIVLITPDNKDFFYTCAGHLTDRAFATPDKDEAAAFEARKKKAELDAEIEKVKKEYSEKMKKKAEKRKEKDKDKGGKDKSKDEEKKEAEEDNVDEKEKDEKIKALEKGKDTPKTDDGPRIFSLHKNFYQQRLDKLRNAELAKRNRERIKNPSSFPSAPTGDPA